jgi:MAE_28990/MAE_18760-like HEPN
MTQPKTLELLYCAIEAEYSWRITELSNFRNTVLSAKGKAKDGMIRAGIALLYAHWEGFVKKSADLYYEFVTYQDCTLSEFNDCFVSIALRSKIESLLSTKKLTIHSNLVKIFFDEQNKKPNFSSSSPIKTSNLKYAVFEDVCVLIGIEISLFKQRCKDRGYDRDLERTIDNDLVDRRNSIAHGDYLPVKEDEFKDLYDIIVKCILYNFKELIIDLAQNHSYKRKVQ